MGLLKCSRCGASIEKDSLQEAVDHLDHSIGKSNGFPCPNDPNQYPVFWNGVAVHFKDGKPIDKIQMAREIPTFTSTTTYTSGPSVTASQSTSNITAGTTVTFDSHSKPKPKKKK